jgi:hypothetical protein
MSATEKNPEVVTVAEMQNIIRQIMKSTQAMNNADVTDPTYGANYYDTLDDIGLTNFNKSVGNPAQHSINQYYDEKRNYSLLAPRLDPLNIHNLTRRVRQSISENDYSESQFFSSVFDKDEITNRFLEKKLIYSKRLEYFRLYDIKKRPPMEQLIALNLLVLDKLDNILRYSTKSYILEKYENQPLGKNFFLKSTFVEGAKTTKIDFTELNKCMNLPANFSPHNFPNTELFSVIIRVDSGGPVQVGFNESESDLSAYVELKANEEHKMENQRALIKSLNIKANGADSVVRIIGLY